MTTIIYLIFQIGKQPAPYYVGSSQTLPRGMYASDRNKVSIGKYKKRTDMMLG